MNESANRAMPEIPSELAGTLPRKVQLNLSEGDARYLLMVVLLFFVGGFILLGWTCYDAISQFQHRASLRNSHHEVIGNVVGFSFARYTPMTVIYRFTVNGVAYSGKATEPATLGSGAPPRKGGEILIRFLPSNPEINHPAAWEWSPVIGWYLTAGVVGAVAIGALVLVSLLRDRKLARNGKAAAAVVLSCSRNGRLFRVDYDFQTEDGSSFGGNTSGRDEFKTGERIWILYLPQKPQRNHRYPLDFFEIVG